MQLDIYGEAIDSLYFANQHGLVGGHQGWRSLCDILNWLTDKWNQPEEGIWETRGGRQEFTYGRLMSWVAFDRGLRLANLHGRPAPLDRWRTERDAIYDQIMEADWSEARQAFVQHSKTDVLDSSLLRMTSVGFISPTDPMWTSTLEAMDGELVTDSLVYRYDPAASPDGLRGSEGTFSLCTFDYVDSLARAGQLEKARNTVREDADLRQPPGPFLGGNRPNGRTDRQLPSGIHASGSDRRCHHAEQGTRPAGTATALIGDLGSRDDLVPSWHSRPPDSSRECAVAEVLGSGIADEAVGVVLVTAKSKCRVRVVVRCHRPCVLIRCSMRLSGPRLCTPVWPGGPPRAGGR